MKKTAQEPETLVLDYDLFSLPTAQHKAGLAGLLLMLDSMKARKIEPLPVEEETTPTSARISFTRESIQAVFDDLYDARWTETESKSRWKEKEPKRIIEKEVELNGKKKLEKRYVYDAVQPGGGFLQALYRDDGGARIKLWRDMLWNILRGIPATRGVYEERAEGKPSAVAGEQWKLLNKSALLRKKGKLLTEGFSSSIFVGAEDMNAERVPFRGIAEHNLLLHFWPVVSLIYVPRVLSLERPTEKTGWRFKREEAGFVLAIPEPSDLETFREDVKDLLGRLKPDVTGFRPGYALIDIYEEGGLEYLYHFARDRVLKGTEMAFSLCALELYHLQKQGNRIKQLAAGRILPGADTLRGYENLRKSATNALFKTFSIRNLLDGKNWYDGADGVFQHYPMPVFVYSRDKSPVGIRFFGADARKKFALIEANLKTIQQVGSMGESELDDQLAVYVYRLIGTYANLKTEERSGKKFKDFRDRKDEKGRILFPQEYRDAREKVCGDAFLAIRGRRDQDFIEYFAGSICSVPQFIREEEYVAIAGALISDWERVKTLSMLALSAHSYMPQTNDDATKATE